MATPDSVQEAFLDLSDVVRVLCAVGFTMRWMDASPPNDVTPTGAPGIERRSGCRVVVTCTKSGLRAVLETSGEECTCPTEQLSMAAGNQEDINPGIVISQLSEPARLMLKELVNLLTKSDTEDDNTAFTSLTDLSATNCNTLKAHKQNSDLQVRTGSSERDFFSSMNEIRTSLVPDRESEIISCPSSPVAGGMKQGGVFQSSSLETLPSEHISDSFCEALCPSPDARRCDDIERRLKLAASCIQEALTLHRLSTRGSRNDKNSVSTPNLFKAPNVSGRKIKSSTAVYKGEPPKSESRKPMTSRTLTSYPVKKTKTSLSDKPFTTRGSTTSVRGRTTSGSVTSGKGRAPSGSVTSGKERAPSGSVTSGKERAPSGFVTSGKERAPSGSVTSGKGRTPGSVTSGKERAPLGSVTSGRGQTSSGPNIF